MAAIDPRRYLRSFDWSNRCQIVVKRRRYESPERTTARRADVESLEISPRHRTVCVVLTADAGDAVDAVRDRIYPEHAVARLEDGRELVSVVDHEDHRDVTVATHTPTSGSTDRFSGGVVPTVRADSTVERLR